MSELQTQFVGKEENLEGYHSACFICAKHLLSENNQNEKSCHEQCSILPIFKHLEINNVEQVKSDDIQPVDKVPLCYHCYQIFIKVSNYCEEFEVLNLKINYFLDKLNQLIVAGNTTENLTTNFDKARKQLKRKLEENCTVKYKTGPLVVLHRLDVNQLSTISYQTTENTSNHLYDDEISDDQYCSSDMDYESDTSQQSKTQGTSPSKQPHHQSRLLDADTTKKPTRNKNIQCSGCNYKCKNKRKLLEHSSLYHPEKHFPSNSKPENLTLPQHKLYLTHLLKTEVDQSRSNTTRFKCAYCKTTLKDKQTRSIRIHLIKEHQSVLLENLAQLQMDISLEEISTKVKIPIAPINQGADNESKLKQFDKHKNKMRTEFTCSICQVRNTNLRKHEAIYHPEKFLLAKRLDHVSLEQFKMYCVHLLNKQVENFMKSQKDRKVRFQCPHCENSYGDLHGCRNHLILNHQHFLSVEIEKLQGTMKPEELNIVRTVKTFISRSRKEYTRSINNPVEINSLTCKICDVRLTQKGMANHMRKNHRREYVKGYKCSVCLICKETFRTKWWLDYHRTSVHTDKLFEKWKVLAVSVEQFKSYVDYIMEKETKCFDPVDSNCGNVRYKCSYCKSTFIDMRYAQMHLVMEHKEIVGNKLEELQKSKTFEDIKQGVDNEREDLCDKIEEDDGFEAGEVFGGKSLVKLEAGESWDENDDEMMGLDDLNENGVDQEDIEIKEEECMDVEAILPN